jgi:hypothetical protein
MEVKSYMLCHYHKQTVLCLIYCYCCWLTYCCLWWWPEGVAGVGNWAVAVELGDGNFGSPHMYDSVVLTKASFGLVGSHIALCAAVKLDDYGGCFISPWPSAIFKELTENTMDIARTLLIATATGNPSLVIPIRCYL